MKKVSVIIPVYNTEEYLPQCLHSVCDQTLTDIEIICVDDGSTDRSLEILKEFQKKDDRIIVLTQKNLQAGVARNRGIEIAQGEYLYFMDSDDFIALDLLERTYAKAEKVDADIVLFGWKKYDTVTQTSTPNSGYLNRHFLPSKEVFSYRDIPETILQVTNPAPWSKLFRRRFIEEKQLRFQNFPNSNDVYFVLTAMCVADRVTYVPDYLIYYRVGQSTNIQNKKSRNPLCFIDAFLGVRTELLRQGNFDAVEKSWVAAMLSSVVFNLNTVKTQEAYRKICRALRSPEIVESGLLSHPLEYYPSINHFELAKSAAGNTIALHSSEERELHLLVEKKSLSAPKVSVVIPVYNVESYIRECLDSIVHQTLTDIEIICVNDGSSDHSLDILLEYASKDERIRVWNQKNSGPSAARNAGINTALGKYIYFMDSDDILEKNTLEELYYLSEEKKLDILFFSGSAFYEDSTLKEKHLDLNDQYIRKGDYPKILPGKDMLCELKKNKDYCVSPCLQFLRREYLQQKDISFKEGIVHEDNLFMFSMIKAERTFCVNTSYFLRRVRSSSIMTQKETISNLIGYYTCLMGQIDIAQKESFTEEQNKYVLQVLETTAWQVRRSYRAIKPIEQEWFKLCCPPEDYYFFDVFIRGTIVDDEGLRAIQNSVSFKVGRAITFFPRKIRGGIRCLKENGLHYTVRHFFEKVQNKMKYILHR